MSASPGSIVIASAYLTDEDEAYMFLCTEV